MQEFDFGQYHVIDELGRGGMAIVYKAVHTQTTETVALKVLYPHLMSDETNIKRFRREAQIASELHHKYIVPVIDFGEHDKQIYIAMQYIQGRTLEQYFEQPRQITIQEIIQLLAQVASALDYAHTQGVIHRDLKLQNILLDDDHHAHLSDFGIAHVHDATRLTATGQIAGTPLYISPEQIKGQPTDHRSDVYSFSVMAYLLLTGYYPFMGDDTISIIHKHVSEIPPTPTDVNINLPESVNTVLLRGLEKRPQDRYSTTQAMVDDLKHVLDTPALQQTHSKIDIRATNPIGSTGANNTTDNPSPTNRATPRNTVSISGRSGLISAVLGVVVLAIIIPAILIIFGGANNRDAQLMLRDSDQTLTALPIHQTQTSAPIIQTQTAFPMQLTQDVIESIEDTTIPNTTPPPTRPAAPPTTIQSFSHANGIITADRPVQVEDSAHPNSQTIARLEDGTPIEIIGKNVRGDFWQIRTVDGVIGFVRMMDVTTNIQANTMPIVDKAERPDRPNNAPPNNGR